jgi:hypothetical protein
MYKYTNNEGDNEIKYTSDMNHGLRYCSVAVLIFVHFLNNLYKKENYIFKHMNMQHTVQKEI